MDSRGTNTNFQFVLVPLEPVVFNDQTAVRLDDTAPEHTDPPAANRPERQQQADNHYQESPL